MSGESVNCIWATASSALCKRSGNVLLRRSARRRIPRHALGLKKKRSGIGSDSKTCHKKHSTPSLRHSEEPSIQSRPAAHIPEPVQRGHELSEVLPFVGREDAWHVLQEEPSRTAVGEEKEESTKKAAPGVVEAQSEPRVREALARGAGDPEVCFGDGIGLYLVDVAGKPRLRTKAALVNAAAEGIDLAGTNDAVPGEREGAVETADTGEPIDHAQGGHPIAFLRSARAWMNTFGKRSR